MSNCQLKGYSYLCIPYVMASPAGLVASYVCWANVAIEQHALFVAFSFFVLVLNTFQPSPMFSF